MIFSTQLLVINPAIAKSLHANELCYWAFKDMIHIIWNNKLDSSFEALEKTLNSDSVFLETPAEYVPLCRLDYIGVSNQSYYVDPFTGWDILSGSCRQTFYFILLLYSLLTISIIASNLCILVVIFHRNSTRTSTLRLYKVSLAVADLLIGLFSLPYILYDFVYRTWYAEMFVTQRKSLVVSARFADKNLVAQIGDICACIFVLSFYASILTLTTAAVDRYTAIRLPFRTQESQLFWAKVSLGGVWLISILLAISVFIKSRFYYQFSSLMFNMSLKTDIEVYTHG